MLQVKLSNQSETLWLEGKVKRTPIRCADLSQGVRVRAEFHIAGRHSRSRHSSEYKIWRAGCWPWNLLVWEHPV